MQVARRLFELGQALSSGLLRALRADGSTAPLLIELERGWIHGVDLSPAYSLVGEPALNHGRGEDRLRLYLKLTDDGHYRFDRFQPAEKRGAPKRGACTPFHPAATVRNHVDGLQRDPSFWRVRVGGGRVQLPAAPHASCVGQDERPLVAFLSRPRTLAEIDASNLCPPARALKLMAFLDAMGALVVTFDSGTSPFAVLELPDGAPLDEVRKAYRRLAFELHPDRHPTATPVELDELERRFAEVSAAYRRLV